MTVRYFNRAHEEVESAEAKGAFYAIKTAEHHGSYEGVPVTSRQHTAWLLSDPSWIKPSTSTRLLREWIDSFNPKEFPFG